VPGDNEFGVERDQLSPTGFATSHGYPVKPCYRIGDILYVRETHYVYGKWVKDGLTKTGKQKYRFVASAGWPIYYEDTLPRGITIYTGRDSVGYYKRPSMFMPLAVARIFLRVTRVRAERVQDISDKDCYAEGIDDEGDDYRSAEYYSSAGSSVQGGTSERFAFAALWDSINHKRGYGWDVNPFVFCYDFEVLEIKNG
jgi:hypothetical protein